MAADTNAAANRADPAAEVEAESRWSNSMPARDEMAAKGPERRGQASIAMHCRLQAPPRWLRSSNAATRKQTQADAAATV